MSDPWVSPSADGRAAQDPRRASPPLPPSTVMPARMSLRSVPDGRQPVPLIWWVPVVAALMLTTTTLAILPVSSGPGWVSAALAGSLVGYALVWLVIRPGRLRLNPPFVTPVGTESMDVTAAITRPIPAVATAHPPTLRIGTLLLRASAVGLGASAVWALLFALLVRPRVPTIPITLSGPEAVIGSLIDALVTSILEESGMAVLIIALAGLAARFLPAHFDSRSAGYLAIAAATLIRTLLHLPLWGVGAFGRIGLSFVLAWLFWRTRRVWPLIVAHVLWDTLALQTLVSPSLEVRGFAALAILGWAITGFIITCVAITHSRGAFRRQPIVHTQRASEPADRS